MERAVQNTARCFGNSRLRFRHGNPSKTFFIIFVDVIFTTLLEQVFTNALDVIGAQPMKACLCRA
jgi:hypothetical protein